MAPAPLPVAFTTPVPPLATESWSALRWAVARARRPAQPRDVRHPVAGRVRRHRTAGRHPGDPGVDLGRWDALAPAPVRHLDDRAPDDVPAGPRRPRPRRTDDWPRRPHRGAAVLQRAVSPGLRPAPQRPRLPGWATLWCCCQAASSSPTGRRHGSVSRGWNDVARLRRRSTRVLSRWPRLSYVRGALGGGTGGMAGGAMGGMAGGAFVAGPAARRCSRSRARSRRAASRSDLRRLSFCGLLIRTRYDVRGAPVAPWRPAPCPSAAHMGPARGAEAACRRAESVRDAAGAARRGRSVDPGGDRARPDGRGVRGRDRGRRARPRWHGSARNRQT